jgi:aspartyl-tRNA(Asn)/glutamyl-tRNA(Gln) amidotransferase subunit A
MARSARDVAALHAVIGAFDPADPWAVDGPIRNPLSKLEAGIEGVRIARLGGFFAEGVDPAVDRVVGDAAEVLGRLGAELVELELPGGAEATANAGELIRAEALSIHLDDLNATPDSFGPDVRERLELGREVSGVDVARALAEMRAWRALLLRHFGKVDLLLTPTTIEAAPEIAGSNMLETTARLTRFTYPWSLAGLPAISVPCGHDAAGLPVGMQLIAAPWRDDALLTAAVAYQGDTDWHAQRPELNVKSERGGADA